VAISTTAGLVLLPFTERSNFADPHPIGLAVGHVDVTGDASGGGISASLLADGGFMFRLEMLQSTLNVTSAAAQNIILAHRWASDRSGLGATAFDMNWALDQRIDAVSAFSTYSPFPADLAMIRRFPLGRTDNVQSQFIVSWNSTNQDTLLYDFDAVFTYWRTEALYRPGFLSSFYEAPEVRSRAVQGS